MKRSYVVAVLAVVLMAGFGYYFFSEKKQNAEATSANSSSLELSDDADWNLGSHNNTVSSSGDLQIDDVASQEIDLASIYAGNPGSVTSAGGTGNNNYPIDNNAGTGWGVTFNAEGEAWWMIDLGSQRQISRFRIMNSGSICPFGYSTNISGSTDNVGYTYLLDTCADYSNEDGDGYFTRNVNFTGRYFKLLLQAGPGGIFPLSVLYSEIKMFGLPSATHTTADTQIDGGVNFWEWESFTPTQTVPENTSLTYRYRSSANGSDWNAWHSDFADVESHSGDTRYRYLQVEATLANTDGASTPTIDSYDIGYHTEVKPTKPTVQSAVAQ